MGVLNFSAKKETNIDGVAVVGFSAFLSSCYRTASDADYWTIRALFIAMTRGGVEYRSLKAKDTKKSEAKAKDSLSEDRPSRGQGQECSRPKSRTKDTTASVLQKKIFKKVFQAIFNL